jgi:hypothetical protein
MRLNICCGSEDIHTCVPMVVLHTQLASEEELHDLRKDVKKFLEPLASATQSMLSTRGRLYCASPPAPVPASPPAPVPASPPAPVPASTRPDSPARAPRQRKTILQMPGFVLTRRTCRRIARVNSLLKPSVYGNLDQTRIRLERNPNTSSSLSTVQDLIQISWAARGISVPLVPGHASSGTQSSQASSAPSQRVLQIAAKREGSV